MRQAITVLALASLLGALAACGGAPRPSKYYQLRLPVTPSADAAAPVYPVSLLVAELYAPHLYRDDRIVYRLSPVEMGTYEYHRWVEPPTEMVGAVLVRILRDSRRFRSVQLQRSNAKGDYIVRGRLNNFEELSGEHLAGRVALEIHLYEVKTGTTVWSQYYSHDEPANSKEVSAVVEALDRNVQAGLREIAAGIDQYFAAHPPK